MRLLCFILLFCLQSAWAADTTLSSGKPSEVGMDATILEAGVNMYRKAIERDEVRSAVILIARKGRVVVHEALGWKDKEGGIRTQEKRHVSHGIQYQACCGDCHRDSGGAR